MNYTEIQEYLQNNSDSNYRLFTIKLVPELNNCFGVRVPIIRSFAKTLSRNKVDSDVIAMLWNSNIYEEKILLGLLLGTTKYTDFESSRNDVLQFIDKIDNWAVCDLFVSALKPVMKNHRESYYHIAIELAQSKNDWHCRFGLVLLLAYFINNKTIDEILDVSNKIISEAYYVRMANAWLLSYVYIFDKEKTIIFLQNSQLDKWTVNKAIQKIRESNRVAPEDKITVLKLKR